MVCLKVGPEDEAFILPYMKPEVEKGDIVNLALYHFYMKTTADESEDAFSGVTVPLDVEESEPVAEKVVAQSRKFYGTPKTEVEERMKELFATDDGRKPQVQSKKSGKGKGSSKKVHQA